jgi:hypothetical protein
VPPAEVPPAEVAEVATPEAVLPPEVPAKEVPPEGVEAAHVLVDKPGLPYDDVPPEDEVVPPHALPAEVLPSGALSAELAPAVVLAADVEETAAAVFPAFMSVLPSPAPIGDGWVAEPALACPCAVSAAVPD